MTKAPEDDPAIDARSLRFVWPGADGALLDLERFHVARGERVFVEGPSGCGKTTLLNLLAGALTPTSGALRILGTELAALSGGRRDRFRADHVGVVFQAFNLVPYLTLIENVVLPCRFSPLRRRRIADAGGTPEGEAMRLLASLGLDGRSFGRRDVARLSAGQQQRVAVARALIGGPELVICDEPTSALDADARDAFLALLLQEAAAAGAAVVFVSHDRALASAFDRTYSLPERNRAAA